MLAKRALSTATYSAYWAFFLVSSLTLSALVNFALLKNHNITSVFEEKKFPFLLELRTFSKVLSVTLDTSTPVISVLVEVTMV